MRDRRRGPGLVLILALAVLASLVAAGGTATEAQGLSVEDRETVGVRVLTKAPAVRVKVRTSHRPVELRVRLNRRLISERFAGRVSTAPPVVVGAGDGLRRGRNRLVVRVWFPGGRRVTRVVRFGVPRRAAVPDAGRDRTVYAGDRVRFSAAGTRLRHHSKARLRWRVVRRPAGSRALLRTGARGRPVLRPDVPGIYRLRLTVTSRQKGQRRAAPTRADVVQVAAVDAQATRAGVFVGTSPLASNGPATALTFFGGALEGETFPLGNAVNPVVTFFLDRQTLEVVGGGPVLTGVDAAAVTTLQARQQAAIKASGTQPLVISAGNNYGTMSSAFATWLTQELGATGIAANASSFSLAGTPPDFFGIDKGSNPVSNMTSVSPDVGGASRLAGQLVRDAQDNWAFTPSSVPAFGTAAAGGIRFDTGNGAGIEIGGKQYPAEQQPPGCEGRGGYQVLAVAASGPNALQPLDISIYDWLFEETFVNGQTFFINACGGGGSLDSNTSIADAVGLRQVLGAIGSQPALVFIQSVGDPRAPSALTDNSFSPLAGFGSEIRNFGGTPKAFLGQIDGNQTATDGPFYTLVGHNFNLPGQPYVHSSAEVSTDGPGSPPARLVGALVKDAHGRYVPTVNTASNDATTSELNAPILLAHLARQVDSASDYAPVAFPGATDPAWQAALAAAAKVLGLAYEPSNFPCYRPPGGISDVRSNYCGGVPADSNVATYWADLYGNCTANPSCLANAPYAKNTTYSQSVWTAVKQQLRTEFQLVDQANQVAAATKQSLTAAMVSDTEGIASSLQTTFTNLANARLRSEGSSGLSWASSIFDELGALAGFFTDDVSTLLWAISAGLGLGSNAVTDADGTPLLAGPITGTSASTLSSQIEDQVAAANLLRDKYRDAVVSDWARLQGVSADYARLPVSETVDASVQGARFGNIAYSWRTLMGEATTLNLLRNNGEAVNPPGTSIQDFQCWGKGGLQKPYASFGFPATHYQYDGSNYALTVLTPDPSSQPAYPMPPGAMPQDPVPTSIMNGFFAAQPPAGTNLAPVVNGAPPGLGIDSRRFYSKTIAVSNGTGATRQVDCNGGGGP
jgi:hypothetical protein